MRESAEVEVGAVGVEVDVVEIEPDYRFLLANERTFLAWIRTALAVLAGGVLLGQLALQLQWHRSLNLLAALLCLLAGGLCLAALTRWRANDSAMRRAQALPRGVEIPLLAVLAMGTALLVAALLVFQLR